MSEEVFPSIFFEYGSMYIDFPQEYKDKECDLDNCFWLDLEEAEILANRILNLVKEYKS